MSTNPKTIDTALAGTLALVNILVALENGTQITDEMVAAAEAVNGKMPPDVRKAVDRLNLMRAQGINKQTINSVPSTGSVELDKLLSEVEEVLTTPCDCPNCVAEREGTEPSKPTTFRKEPANFMPKDQENEVVLKHVHSLLDGWKDAPELSAQFPVLVACGLLTAYGDMVVDTNFEGRMLLKSIDMTRQMIADDLGLGA